MALLDDITQKKRALDDARPLPPEVVRDLADWFELELTKACNAVEGGELATDEVRTVLDRGAVLRHRPPEAQRLVLNHRSALELMARLSYQPGGVVTERTVAAFHGVLYQGIDEDAGKYREGPLKDGSVGASPDPAKVRVSMSALSGWLRRTEPSPEAAFEAHHRLMSVRPFFEGNAATALLLCNLILNRAGYPPVAVRTEDAELYRGLVERAWSVGDKTPFRDLMMRFLDRSLDVCLLGASKAPADAGAAEGAGEDA
ncbi:Fic family protein [Azospirillum rugosum]|uniref:Fic family protein n=1 Tax=Azospirillum rugosum TaxID=416170 RepID=A0ABS4SD13_9PROT|nr:Fic family protein [Azospirillum rugosum]MBP2290456.1 Fic family protein [Azospirillum rugosum]MDQ0527932.1 Fic family protein [Azospirillum rugosum]